MTPVIKRALLLDKPRFSIPQGHCAKHRPISGGQGAEERAGGGGARKSATPARIHLSVRTFFAPPSTSVRLGASEGSSTNMTKFVEWPVVESVPARVTTCTIHRSALTKSQGGKGWGREGTL